MTPELVSLTVAGAALTGAAYGAGPCAATCLPYMGPVFFAGDFRAGARWEMIGLFSAGRLIGYTFLATLAGFVGGALADGMIGTAGRYLLGGAMIATGVLLAMRRRSCHKPCGTGDAPPSGGFLAAGFGLALNPCAPLLAVNSAAALTGSALDGACLGFAYGVGAVTVPAIIFGSVIAAFGRGAWENVGRLRPTLEIFAATSMIFVGVATISGMMTP